MTYIDAVLKAGGLPVPLIAAQDEDLIEQQLAGIEGLIITGGPDVPARLYGRKSHPKTKPLCRRRASHELALTRRAEERQMPILAICLGCQVLNVVRGGTLCQHLDDLPRTPPVRHNDPDDYIIHTVRIQPGSLLSRIIPQETIQANSSHHQAIEQVGKDLEPVAWAPDGTIEAIEDPSRPFLLGVQWHPEALSDKPEHAALFAAIVEAAGSITKRAC